MSMEDVARSPAEFAKLLLQLCDSAMRCEQGSSYLKDSVRLCHAALRAKGMAVVRTLEGRWDPVVHVGADGRPPTELLEDALDGESVVHRGAWWAVPITRQARDAELLVVEMPDPREATAPTLLGTLGEVIRLNLQLVRQRERAQSRVHRLETMLTITAEWTKTLEMSELLERIAAASTQLLECERASIFLWDQQARVLVGRPALGTPNGELRIPEDTGVVGQVVRTGELRRVTSTDESREIDHTLDAQLKFRTRSILCAPLRGKNGAILGAFELLNKRQGEFLADDEAALTELAAHAGIALENSQQHEQLLRSRSQLVSQAADRIPWIGECPAMQKLKQTIERVAATDLAVLILGENGTGKEVVSQMIHYLSGRRGDPFVAVNCAALPDTLLESELFGHERGAFTDARETRQGKFELASGGTLLLDEIGDMSLGGQAKLLRVLEQKVVVRLGGSTPIHTDARILAATNQKLAELVGQKRFRQDLFFRLTVVTLELPPLRDRGDDVLLLAEHFLREFSVKARRTPPTLTAAARKRLLGHSWPGNVRELRNLMERLTYLSPSDKIDADELSFILTPPSREPSILDLEMSLSDATREFQVAYIQRQIERARNNMTDAAERLGLHRSNLYRKMKQLGMETVE